MSDGLTMWVIYDHPADYPDYFVVRKWNVTDGVVTPLRDVHLFDTAEHARDSLPYGLVLSPVSESDPSILEVWL